MKYRKKPVVIDAVQFLASEPGDPLTFSELPDWLSIALDDGTLERRYGDTINGSDWDFIAVCRGYAEGALIPPDDFIIRGVEGEIYPCNPRVFRATYELATEDVNA